MKEQIKDSVRFDKMAEIWPKKQILDHEVDFREKKIPRSA